MAHLHTPLVLKLLPQFEWRRLRVNLEAEWYHAQANPYSHALLLTLATHAYPRIPRQQAAAG